MAWVEFHHNKDKIRLRIDTIVTIRPCGIAAYGTNIDVNTACQIIAVDELPDEVWNIIQKELTI